MPSRCRFLCLPLWGFFETAELSSSNFCLFGHANGPFEMEFNKSTDACLMGDDGCCPVSHPQRTTDHDRSSLTISDHNRSQKF